MKWFQVKEKSAGKKRLVLTFYIYKIFGLKGLQIVAFLVSMVSFLINKDLRNYSKKILETIYEFSKTSPKPTAINQFKHIFSYSLYLADKIRIFCGDFDNNKIIFESNEAKDLLYDNFKNKKGLFLITTHLGNIEVLRSFLIGNSEFKDNKINVFLSKSQTKIFDEFIKKIEKDVSLEVFPVEEIDVSTAITIKENIDNGQFVFMAGDRLSQTNENASSELTLFGKKVKFPIGTFKFAKLMECPICFVAAIKTKNDCYNIYLKETSFDKNLTSKKAIQKMQQEYADFLQEKTLIAPFQFFHFYDIFQDK